MVKSENILITPTTLCKWIHPSRSYGESTSWWIYGPAISSTEATIASLFVPMIHMVLQSCSVLKNRVSSQKNSSLGHRRSTRKIWPPLRSSSTITPLPTQQRTKRFRQKFSKLSKLVTISTKKGD